MRRLMYLLLVSMLAITAGVAAQIAWQGYRNPTYGYAIALPLGPFLITDAASEKGLTLVEEDGRGQIDIYGAVNSEALSPAEFEQALAGAERIREITYARRSNSWFVISGYYRREDDSSDDLIFYAKFMFSPDRNTLSAFEASYPISAKRRYDPIIERMEDSLTAPR